MTPVCSRLVCKVQYRDQGHGGGRGIAITFFSSNRNIGTKPMTRSAKLYSPMFSAMLMAPFVYATLQQAAQILA